MRRDIYFFEHNDPRVPPEPPLELVHDFDQFVRARGYRLLVDSEDSFVSEAVKREIMERGIRRFFAYVRLTEAVLPAGAPREQLTDLLAHMLGEINLAEELLIIDPYLFPKNADPGYMPYVESLFRKAFQSFSRLEVVTRTKSCPGTRAAFRRMVSTVVPAASCTIRHTDTFHDRFWIADGQRGVFVGTSLNGIGKRYSLCDYMEEADVKEVYAAFRACF